MLDRGPKPWRTEDPGVIGIRGIGYYLGHRSPICEIPGMAADPQQLAAFHKRGFRFFWHSDIDQSGMAVRACRETFRRSGMCPADIDAVLVGWAEHRFYNVMQERLGTRIVRDLGFHNIHVVGIGLSGCCTFAALLRMARNLIIGEGYRSVLVVETNRGNPDGTDRLVLPDRCVYSDGAASCVVTTEAPEFALRSVLNVHQALPNFQIIGVNSVTMHRPTNSMAVWGRVMAHAGVTPDDIKQLFAPNGAPPLTTSYVNRLKVPMDRVFFANIPWIAHPWGTDVAINLYNYCQHRPPSPGDLFMGLAWAEGSFGGMVLERTAHPMMLEPPEFPWVDLDDLPDLPT